MTERENEAVYSLRPLKIDDVERVMTMIDRAKVSMRDVLGIDQWQAGYPNADTFRQDAEKGIGVVLLENDLVVGVCALITDGEPTYAPGELSDHAGEFPGKWLTGEGHYAAVHRVCVDGTRTCRGLGTRFLTLLFDKIRTLGFTSVRIDTHRGNAPMRALLKKNGFLPVGVIYIPEPHTNERIAYEKCL